MGLAELLGATRTIALFLTLIASTVSVWLLRRSYWIRFQAPLSFALFQAMFALMMFSLIALLSGGIYTVGPAEFRRSGLIFAEVLFAFASCSIIYALVFWNNGNSEGE